MKSLYLIGFRAVGKTTLGKALSELWEMEFVDLDEELEKKIGNLAKYVEKNSIEAFRKAEEETLKTWENQQNEHCIVATGGGIADWPASVAILEKSKFPKIYMHLPAAILWERIKNSPEKQQILPFHDLAQLESLYNARHKIYNKIATFHLETRDIKDALSAMEKIKSQLRDK